jgi:hypothetical protein
MSEDETYDLSADPADREGDDSGENELDDPEEYELEQEDLQDEGTLDASDTLLGNPGDDPLDPGIEPADRWSAGERFGDTLAEERAGESLDQLLAEEEPEPDPYAEAESERAAGQGEDDEPEPRSGRLVAEDEGAHSDTEPDLVARDVGIDAGGAGAEEAAVHVDDDPDRSGR